MEGAILSTASNNRFRSHLKNAASALCARTLPKQRRSETAAASSGARHHTYPRATPPKRVPIPCRVEPLLGDSDAGDFSPPEHLLHNGIEFHAPEMPIKFKGSFAREVANAWSSRIGPPDQPAAADLVKNLFNDIQLYPTNSQVFEMLVCARQCAKRQKLVLTFGEFCVFAAELRRCSRQARQTASKPESPQRTFESVNGSEASPPPYEVFLGGSCNPTTWRSDIAIPMLKDMGITYFNPQVEDWSTELMEVEHRAKAAARALLFVLDSETRAVAASVEAAHLATAPRDLLLVLKPYSRHQRIGRDVITDIEYVELSRARATLQEAVERRGLPAFTDIPSALRCAGAVLRGARTHPRHSLGHTILRLKRAYDAAGGRGARLPRARAVDALREVTRAPRDLADRCLPPTPDVDFETFCAAVAELASDAESGERNGHEAESGEARAEGAPIGLHVYNARLKAYGRKLGLFIPKNGGRTSGDRDSPGSGDSVLTPGTERRLECLPAMLATPTYDVYLGGTFPSNGPRPEDVIRREGFKYIVPRPNDYTRMFSKSARRAAPAHPESPRHDKKPRPDPDPPAAPAPPSPADDVQLRERPAAADARDRLSASDFYKVTEDITPQPFKGTYDEDLLLGSRVLVFSMSSEAPCFATMVLAAHYMGLRPAHTVLLVQPMDPVAAHPYSEAAIKDYNRGRHYLADLARRSGVPVFDDAAQALHCALQRLKNANTA